ncbi:Glycine receptor subunit alpha-3 [Holothuria leucospilota]|uniref:Glycine receptor subunit alpha-3 n=1 Tax=Holothuria leucospilota TaxID=206669 RepID=A0A9Q1CCT3_HOLLE|nr:Glycine receptor subunit alpha-3 [Holothuria leucospilota]
MDLIPVFNWICLFLLSILCDARGQQSSSYSYWNNQTSEDVIKDPATVVLLNLLGTYDSRLRPDSEGDPTLVSCKIEIISIDSVTEVTMDYKMTLILEEKWNDRRLNFERYDKNLKYIQSKSNMAELWQPDIFFSNEKQAYVHDVTVPNMFIRIMQNGDIIYSMKLSLVLSCAMNFTKFPMDRQRCTTAIESYQSLDEEVRLAWYHENPVRLIKQINLPQYKLDNNLTYSNRCAEGNGIFEGNYTCLEFSFILERELTFYVVQTFLPTSLLVIMSWVSFWIDITQAPARVSLGVTIILTMTTTTTGFGSAAGLPRVSYTKAIDVWFDMCLGFVTMSLLEYAFVHYLWNRDMESKHLQMASRKTRIQLPFIGWQKGKSKPDVEAESAEEVELEVKMGGERYNYSTTYRPLSTKEDDIEGGFVAYNGNAQHGKKHYDRRQDPVAMDAASQGGSLSKLVALNIDRVSRILFPFSFVIAVLAYWILYTYIVDDHFV